MSSDRPAADRGGDAERATREQGIALALVLAVLVCLVSVAIPFALSMRHEQGGIAYRANDDEARRETLAVRDLALAHLGATAPERDDSPWVDGPGELALDVAARARELGFGDLGPNGRLLSATLEDQSGRIDLNATSLLFTARLLGLATTLSSKLAPDDRQIRLVDGDFLADQGFLWIDGEVTYYQRKDGSTVYDFKRPALVPGVWEPATMAQEPREFAAGTPVIDFRAWMVAAWSFKARPNAESRFETITQPLAISDWGRGALGPMQRARLEQFGTIWSADGGRDRFGNAQRILSPLVGGQTASVRIEQGQFAGRGLLARITTFGGAVDHLFVVRCQEQGDSAELSFEMPTLLGCDAGQAKVEFLLPRPVNVNSCSRDTLVLLLDGLELRGGGKRVDARTAALVATRLIQARPLDGMRGLIAVLDPLVEKEKVLDPSQRHAILLNAEHSGCYDLETSSLPFAYATDGVVEVRAAASLNYELNGREKARAFLREVLATAAAGPSARVWKTQRDFDEPWRISRLARGWTTYPENLQFWGGGMGAADPPSRLVAMASPRLRFPSEELNETGARLAPAWYDLQAVPNDRTWHFDGRRDDFESKDPDGWRLADGPIAINADGSAPGVALTQSLPIERPKPFGVSLWWNPGTNLGGEQTLWDWQCNSQAPVPGLSDRVRLRLVGGKLEFEVHDAFLRASDDDLYTSKIVYDFTDGLPLEADTWYHVTTFCRGNRAGQMSLWVDGKPRGKYSHYSRLTGTFTASARGANRIALDPKRLAAGTGRLPPRSAARVNNEVFEYSAVNAAALTVTHDDADHFGGIRPGLSRDQAQAATSGGGQTTSSVTHPASSGVELYGYSARLESDLPAGNATLDTNGLGKFGVAIVSPAMAQANIDVAITQRGGGGGGPPNITLGRGFDSDVTTIVVTAPDGGKLPAQKPPLNKNGGYAALVGYFFGTVKPRDGTTGDEGDTLDSHTTTTGSYVQGIEVIHYGGFDGAQLTNVKRGHTLKTAELKATDYADFNLVPTGTTNTVFHFVDKHAWVVQPDKKVFASYDAPNFTILVVPLSVVVNGNPKQSLLVPEAQSPGADRCEMAQIGDPSATGVLAPSEWIRYDAIVQDANGRWNLLRADPKRLAAAHYYARQVPFAGNSNTQTYDANSDLLYAIAKNPANYAMSQSGYESLVDGLNDESLGGGDPDGNLIEHRLAFRGVLDTSPDGEQRGQEHDGGVPVYPVWRTARTGPLPGRYDEITIVGGLRERPERHFINYAWSQDSAEDWGGSCHCALLAAGAAARFVRVLPQGAQANNPTSVVAAMTFNFDSRNFARILKFPSGELPGVADPGSQLVIGGAAGGAGRSGGTGGGNATTGGLGDGAKIDEVRVFATEDPSPTIAHGMHVLNRELTATESNRFEVGDDLLRFPHQSNGQIGATPNLHVDACVWQIGDEFVICGERQLGQPVVQEIAQDGRLRFSGADRFYVAGYHPQGATAQVLPWLVMTRLAGGLGTGDSEVTLVDPAGFPAKGCLLIDQEVVGYTGRTDGGSGAGLYIPTFLADPAGRSSQSRGEAAFRGRYGTPVMSHSGDAVVFFWPYRYVDGYQERCDIPEMTTLELPIASRRALFHALSWNEEKGDPLAKLVATVRVQGRGGFVGDPDDDPDLFVFDSPGTREKPNRIDRQGDLLRIRFNVDYLAGALDPVDFTRNSWKRAPFLTVVSVEQLADRVVELHEESR